MLFRTIGLIFWLQSVTADASPTGRALRALELMQAQPGITAAQLAAQLGVTERPARRYVAILR
jgi:predicted DNA-binding transcriptional regulator YafY